MRNIIYLLNVLALLSSLLSISSAQSWPGNEVNALYLYDAEFPPLNICNLGLPNPCFENDGGYNPIQQGSFAGYFSAVSPFVSGGFTNWQITGNNLCVADIDTCDATSGELLEAMCGHNMNAADPMAFSALFLQHIWLGT